MGNCFSFFLLKFNSNEHKFNTIRIFVFLKCGL